MNTETYSDDEDVPALSPDKPVFTLSDGGIFAGSQSFTLAGGTFNNIMENHPVAPAVPPDFRMIPMGDIDLQQELMVNEESGVVGRRGRRARNPIRRVYSAKIDGRNSNVTAAVYQGDGAEDDWRRDTEMYMSVRHPNIVQVWAGASYGNMHTTVFHGDLVPLEQFLAPQSRIMTVYLYAGYSEEWGQVYNYFRSLGQRVLNSWECTMWIRCSTGRLSVDLVPSGTAFGLASDPRSVVAPLRQAATLLNITKVIAIESLGLRQYHRICALYLSQYWDESVPPSATVHIGAVTSWPSGHRYEGHVEIALPAEMEVFHHNGWGVSGDGEGDLMGNGWTRYRADDVFKTEISLWMLSDPDVWLSQANHVFSNLQITSNFEDYGLVERFYFIVTFENTGQDPPPGYLFLCPTEDFQTGPASFRWPNRPAYWSLNPEGIKVLSTEEALRLGFPPFQLTTRIQGKSWDDGVYAGLRKFHQAKGFNSDSQDVARHLGYPLYELCEDVNSPFAHVDEFNEAEATADEIDTEYESVYLAYEGSDAEDSVDKDTISVQQQAPGFDQESMDGGYTNTGTNHEADFQPQTADRPTGGFIHRIFGALRHSLVVEVDNIDTDPISPFPI